MVDLDSLEKRMLEVRDAYAGLKQKGFNQDILEIYLMHKCKLSRKQVKQMLNEMEYFYKHLIAKETAKKV